MAVGPRPDCHFGSHTPSYLPFWQPRMSNWQVSNFRHLPGWQLFWQTYRTTGIPPSIPSYVPYTLYPHVP